MRIATIYTQRRQDAVDAMPWAAKIIRVDGGYTGFESVEDYRTWRNQK